MILYRFPTRHRAAGYSLIEVLISLAVISIAMLGAAGLQLTSLKMSKGASFRAQAVLLSSDISERMEANKTASLAGDYVVGLTSTPVTSAPNCLSTACTATQLASYDIAAWGGQITNTLKGVSWRISQTVTGNPSTYEIVINWEDRRTKTTYTDSNTVEGFSYTATKVIHE